MNTDERTQGIRTYYIERHNYVRSMVASAEEGIWQYLLAVNGGSAVAVLAFIGSSQEIRAKPDSFFVLGVFIAGLVFVALGRVMQFYIISNVLHGWNADMTLLLEEKLEFKLMLDNDRRRSLKFGKLVHVVGWSSLICFCYGLFRAVCFVRQLPPFLPASVG